MRPASEDHAIGDALSAKGQLGWGRLLVKPIRPMVHEHYELLRRPEHVARAQLCQGRLEPKSLLAQH
jgi:hypothetical protein